jgi:hypothetical protein
MQIRQAAPNSSNIVCVRQTCRFRIDARAAWQNWADGITQFAFPIQGSRGRGWGDMSYGPGHRSEAGPVVKPGHCAGQDPKDQRGFAYQSVDLNAMSP